MGSYIKRRLGLALAMGLVGTAGAQGLSTPPAEPSPGPHRNRPTQPADDAGPSPAATRAELAQIARRLDGANQELDRLLRRFTERYPAVIVLRREIRALQRTRARLIARLAAAPPSAADQSRPDSTTGAPATGPWTPKILTNKTAYYLPDFSFAGYRWGEAAIPGPTGQRFDVTDFGATPNDRSDDTKAIQRAIVAAQAAPGPAVVAFPSGRFIVTEILHLSRGQLVLVGAGSGRKAPTQLYFPQPISVTGIPASLRRVRLADPLAGSGLDATQASDAVTIDHSTVAYIHVETARDRQSDLATARRGRRGGHRIALAAGSTPAGFRPGQVVEIGWCRSGCDQASFLKHLFDRQRVPIGAKTRDNAFGRALVRQPVTITAVDDHRLTIKEPLLHHIKPAWAVGIRTTNYLEGVGVEGLQLVFPNRPFPAGHSHGLGYHGLYYVGVDQSWVRDLKVVNADNAVRLAGSKNVSLEKLRTVGRRGHYSVNLVRSHNVLVKDFELSAHFIHNPSFSTAATRNVFTDGTVEEARFDQHRGVNQQNLIDHVRVRMDNIGQLFEHSGADYRAPTAGAFTAFWNITVRFERDSRTETKDAPSAIFVGLTGTRPITLRYGPNAYREGINRPGIAVPSLYRYQLEARLNPHGHRRAFLSD